MNLEDGVTRFIEDDWSKDSDWKEAESRWTGVTTLRERGAGTSTPVDTEPSAPKDVKPEGDPSVPIDRSRPWNGPEPPKPLLDLGQRFVRRVDGVWCKPDASGRLYPVDAVGERWMKPLAEDRPFDFNRRPPDVSTHVWISLRPSERKKWWEDKRAAKPEREAMPALCDHMALGVPDFFSPTRVWST